VFFVESSGVVFEAPAFITSFDDIAVMGEPVEHGGCHFCITKYLWPVGKGEIGCDDDRGVFVKLADQVEQELGTGLAKRQIAQFVDDDEVVAQQFLDDFSASSLFFDFDRACLGISLIALLCIHALAPCGARASILWPNVQLVGKGMQKHDATLADEVSA
jgi:hypothetical protein